MKKIILVTVGNTIWSRCRSYTLGLCCISFSLWNKLNRLWQHRIL